MTSNDTSAISYSNAWVDNYLQALLSSGLSNEYIQGLPGQKGLAPAADPTTDKDMFAYTQYYVKQILNADEDSLIRAWAKSTSSHDHLTEQAARQEYLTWRVWHLKRMQVQNQKEIDDFKAKAVEVTLEQEDSVTEISSASSQQAVSDTPHEQLAEINENEVADDGVPGEQILVSDAFTARVNKLYIVLISLHGLVRGMDMELGKDPDTGGQVKYVVELARSLAYHPAVFRVELLTRLIKDPKVHEDYGEAEECLYQGEGDTGGAYIVRLPCGPTNKYVRKEELWPYVREFADNGINHVRNMVSYMQQNEAVPVELYVIHGHYADAGEVAAVMSHSLGTDMVLTGHSLGRNKLDHLYKMGMSMKDIEEKYAISRRIEGEERALDAAVMTFTSTQQEVDMQWGLYDGYDPKLEKALRSRGKARSMPMMKVIPPGLDFSKLKVQMKEDPFELFNRHLHNGDSGLLNGNSEEQVPSINQTLSASGFDNIPRSALSHEDSKSVIGIGVAETDKDPEIWKAVFRFLRNPRKPAILAMSRPDAKKNIRSIVIAYAQNKLLRELANLVLIMGNRDVIDKMAKGSASILEEVLKLIDQYDLYGSVAYPKAHSQSDVGDIYKLSKATKGVFTNVALQEPFGLTLIEAAAVGVPIVATCHGGPVDIIKTLKNGIIVEPTDTKEVGDALVKIVADRELWKKFSKNGLDNITAYSWPAHCIKYLENIEHEKVARKKIGQKRGSSSWDTKQFEDALAAKVNTKSEDDTQIETTPVTSPASASRYRLKQRSYLCIFTLDIEQNAPKIANMLKNCLLSLESWNANPATCPLGFAVVSMMGVDTTKQILIKNDVNLASLDALISNGGASLSLQLQNGDGFENNEAYEAFIYALWDKAAFTRNLTNVKHGQGDKGKQLLISRDDIANLSDDAPKVAPSQFETGPYHILLQMNKDAVDSSVTNADIFNGIMKKMRTTGTRINMAVQSVPIKEDNGKQLTMLHITPKRASRALALRYLSIVFEIPMENQSVFVCPKTVVGNQLNSYVSDIEDLIGGASKAYIVPVGTEEEMSENGCELDISPFLACPDRVKVLTEDLSEAYKTVALDAIGVKSHKPF
eukprot:TRINITY_DN3573_c0_g1_i5.p1 TRINITY_DN3573_c0_g1~~TRINITY_DN3573_c0_g1_i5.p1  ORF type:complete len:1098 (-),score=219.39 TRINITY_DN3573_c0_g1_i5:655-3948(-)